MDRKVAIFDMHDWSALFVERRPVFHIHRVETHDLEETREMIGSPSPSGSQTA